MNRRRFVFTTFATALIVGSVVGCKSNPPLTAAQMSSAVEAGTKKALASQPAAPTADQVAAAVAPEIPTPQQIAAATVTALKASGCLPCSKRTHNAAAKKREAQPAPAPAPAATAPAPAPAPAPQPAPAPTPMQAQTQPPPAPAAPPTAIPVNVSFPSSIRVESALTDVPPCPPSAPDQKGKKKPCGLSLAERQTVAAERQTVAQEQLAKNTGKLVWPARIIAGAAVVSAGTDVWMAAHPAELKVNNDISCSTVTGQCGISTGANILKAIPAFKGAGGTIFTVASAPAK